MQYSLYSSLLHPQVSRRLCHYHPRSTQCIAVHARVGGSRPMNKLERNSCVQVHQTHYHPTILVINSSQITPYLDANCFPISVCTFSKILSCCARGAPGRGHRQISRSLSFPVPCPSDATTGNGIAYSFMDRESGEMSNVRLLSRMVLPPK